MPGHQLLLEDRCFDLLDLRGEHLQHLARMTRQTGVSRSLMLPKLFIE
jgi:hypothetical protein